MRYPVTPSVNILIALPYLQPTEVKVLYILSQNRFVLERIQPVDLRVLSTIKH
jgi:hypothetical protein